MEALATTVHPWTPGWVRSALCPAFERAGVMVNGNRPWDPQVHHPRVLKRAVLGGTIGAGESYMDGEWDCDALDELSARLAGAEIDRGPLVGFLGSATELFGHLFNRQGRRRASRNVVSHYDRGNELYRAMLGPSMTYSCGYWREASTLEAAQDAKHDLICRKLMLKPGMRVLDVGCGWGAFAKFAATHHDVAVTGITLSPAQADFARQSCAGLPVDIRLQDYRAVPDHFDRVVCIGMFEHVGVANYRRFFKAMREALNPDGLLLLHTIGNSISSWTIDPWVNRYIFPNANLPSAAQINRSTEGLFVLEDWHNFGPDYDRTLLSWHRNLVSAWPELRKHHDQRFRRMWRYYLLTCAGTFRARRNQLWQIVFAKRGVLGGYRRVGN
jgi:cyclopropane-fatty-acyl-phospholipid synthase